MGANNKGSSLVLNRKSFEGAIILKFSNVVWCLASSCGIILYSSLGYSPLNKWVSKNRSLYLIHNFLIELI